jgi:nucleoid DNA-binding protein
VTQQNNELVNRKELARRIARRGGYEVGEIENVLKLYEDIIEEALNNNEEIKQGKLFKLFLQKLPEKEAWDGLNKKYFTRPAKQVPKVHLLKRLTDIEIPIKEEEE